MLSCHDKSKTYAYFCPLDLDKYYVVDPMSGGADDHSYSIWYIVLIWW